MLADGDGEADIGLAADLGPQGDTLNSEILRKVVVS